MACPLTQGGACGGCQECNPELYLPSQDPYFGGVLPGGDQDAYEQPGEHPH